MTIRGTKQKAKLYTNLPAKSAKTINFSNVNKTLEACIDKLKSLGLPQLFFKFKPNSLEQAILQLENCARTVATKTSNLLATDLDSLKFNLVGKLIFQLIKLIEASINAYDRLITTATPQQKIKFDNYLVQFSEMVTELTAAVEEKVKNANIADWRLSQHEGSFEAGIANLNHLYDSTTSNSVSEISDSTSITNKSSDNWSNWSYATDSTEASDSFDADYATLVINTDNPQTFDEVSYPATMFVKTEANCIENSKQEDINNIIKESINANSEINANKHHHLPQDYFSNLHQWWQQASKRSAFHSRSHNTRNLDGAFTTIINSTENDEAKLQQLLKATNDWLTNEHSKKFLVTSSRYKDVIKLKHQLEKQFYLMQLEPDANCSNQALLNQTLDLIQELAKHLGGKGGFKKIIKVIERLRDNEDAENNIELFRRIQKIAAQRLAGKSLSTFFACFTRSQQKHAIYDALVQAELICHEQSVKPLEKLKENLHNYLIKTSKP